MVSLVARMQNVPFEPHHQIILPISLCLCSCLYRGMWKVKPRMLVLRSYPSWVLIQDVSLAKISLFRLNPMALGSHLSLLSKCCECKQVLQYQAFLDAFLGLNSDSQACKGSTLPRAISLALGLFHLNCLVVLRHWSIGKGRTDT